MKWWREFSPQMVHSAHVSHLTTESLYGELVAGVTRENPLSSIQYVKLMKM